MNRVAVKWADEVAVKEKFATVNLKTENLSAETNPFSTHGDAPQK